MITLTVLAETAKTLTVGWTPVSGAAGYEFLVDGKRVSNTWDATRWSAKFSKPDSGEHTYSVLVLGKTDEGDLVWPAVGPPPPSGVTPPQPPLALVTTEQDNFDSANPSTIAHQHIKTAGPYGNGLKVQGYFTASSAPAPSPSPFAVHDLIGEVPGAPRANNDPKAGEDQAGLWFGTAVNGSRLIGSGPWSGMELAAQCRQCEFDNIVCAALAADGSYTAKLPNVGCYIEHGPRGLKISNLYVRSAMSGVKAEWTYLDAFFAKWIQADYPAYPAGYSGSLDIEIFDFDIDTDFWAFELQPGACGYKIHDGKIRGANGIQHPTHLAIPSMPNVIDWSTIDCVVSGQKEYINPTPF